MSYSLIYDKQFIKAEKDGKEVFFPMVYGGSSNCFDIGKNRRNGRRSRSWYLSNRVLNGKYFGTLDEMLKNIDEYRDELIKSNKERNERYIADGNASFADEYEDKRFGYFVALAIGSYERTTFGTYKGLYKTGCKKALTVEQLRQFNISVSISTFIYNDKDLAAFKEAGKEEIYFSPATSQELIEKIEYFEEYIKGFHGVSLDFSIYADEAQMKRIRKRMFPTKKTARTIKEIEEYFVIYISNYGYLYSYRGSSFRYTHYQNSGKKFLTKKEADKKAKELSSRFSEKYVFNVEFVKEKTKVYA